MSKNLCPENNLNFENSQQIRFEIPIIAGTYTASSVIESTDTDSSLCLMLFYYADGNTKEVYIGRSENGERVSKTFDLSQDATRVRIYASEGYSLSVGDTGIFTDLMIESGSVATDYVPYGDDPEPGPIPEKVDWVEQLAYWMAMAGKITLEKLPEPTCRETKLIRRYLDPTFELDFTLPQSRVEQYLMDLVNGTTTMLAETPKSDCEKYLYIMIGGTLTESEMPNPDSSELNYWMNEYIKTL